VSNATNDTAPRHMWLSSVDDLVIAKLGPVLERVGPTGEWLRGTRARTYLHRAYLAGEPAWMAADAAIQMARGERLANMADRDTIGAVLRRMALA
jgi:hypothetical protein